MLRSTNSTLQRKEAVLASNEYLREVANEPSLGMYYLQEHVKTSVPALMDVKGRFKECTKSAKTEIHSLNNSVYSVKHFCGSVPGHLDRIKARLDDVLEKLQAGQE
ncbi:hypothetical protein HOP50_06g43640 [Chloropicon primus]|nr:hypothetical protein A3770_06p43410 [Chloropicon primus]UPR01043.1 hypothetical protein HOP50_06g43640 [Chloropicon primus]|eukprot:QDZ21823.1 hypothetical protein A3770_06p43410 [Chloropicon primus]